MKAWGIFGKLFVAFLLSALIPVGLTWYVARDITTRNARELAEARLQNELIRVVGRTEGWLDLNHQALLQHGATPAIRSMKPEQLKGPLVSIAASQPWTVLAFVCSPDGMSVGRSDNRAPINYADREYFQQALSGRPYGQQMLISRTTGQPSWTLSVPIRDDTGNVLGVIAKSNALSEITNALTNQRIGRTGAAMLISPDAKLVARTATVMGKELKDVSTHPAVVSKAAAGTPFTYVDEGRPVLAVAQTIRFDWKVAVQMDEAEILEPVRSTDRAMLLLLLAAAVLAALFALIVAPTMARPIKRLTTIADEISRGRFDHELPEAKRRDEIGGLARAIERMTKSLRIAMHRLAERK